MVILSRSIETRLLCNQTLRLVKWAPSSSTAVRKVRQTFRQVSLKQISSIFYFHFPFFHWACSKAAKFLARIFHITINLTLWHTEDQKIFKIFPCSVLMEIVLTRKIFQLTFRLSKDNRLNKTLRKSYRQTSTLNQRKFALKIVLRK